MRKFFILSAASIAFGTQLFASIATANAAGCATTYATCQQTCKNYSAGGKDFGVGLWDASRSKACFQGCLTERNKCNMASVVRSSTTSVGNRHVLKP